MMEKNKVSYDWETYYRAAYEKEKKKNTLLASRLADAQGKEEELGAKLGRIENSIFWKLSAPFRKCYYAFQKPPVSGRRVSPEGKEWFRDYRQEVFRQKHPYLQWIEENEASGCRQEIRPENRSEGWRKIEMTNSELCVVICGNGVLDEAAKERIRTWFQENPDCVFAYGDEDYYWKDLSGRMHPRFKPCWSPDTMLAFCYVGHMIIVNKALYHGLSEGKIPQEGSYGDFYDLCFRLEERVNTLRECDRLARSLQEGDSAMPLRVGNIERVLFHNRFEPDPTEIRRLEETERSGGDALEAAEELLQEKLEQGYDMTGCGAAFRGVREAALRRRGIRAELEPGAEEDIYHVCYDVEEGPGTVSAVILSRDHPEVLEQCLSSFREKTEYPKYEWIVVDNGSSNENRAKTESLQKEYGFRYLYQPMEFNFSALCNLGVRAARGEYILLLNDDIEIIQKDWLRILLGQAMQPGAGAVGAKLWYAGSNTIQHAGITNMGIGPSHKLASLEDDRCYYYGRNRLAYNVAGVTAACMMIEKKKYLEVGGLDETMKVAYNDVDFCFRLLEAGYFNVLRNDAVLYHFESRSRGLDQESQDKWNRLLEEKEALYAKHPKMRGRDPFYHKNLNDDNIRYTCNFKYDYGKKEKLSEVLPEEARILERTGKNVLHLVVDQAGEQRKASPKEAEILTVSGWSYLPGEDNAEYTRKLLLQREDGVLYVAEPFPWYRKDVEEVLTREVNILLAGFVARFGKEKLPAGRWKIGVMAENVENHKKAVAWSDKVLTIEP